jgi:hypothetical protein
MCETVTSLQNPEIGSTYGDLLMLYILTEKTNILEEPSASALYPEDLGSRFL